MKLIYLLFLVPLALLAQYLSKKHCLDKLGYEMSLSAETVECGEEFEIACTLSNYARFPKMFLRLCQTVPASLQLKAENSSAKHWVTQLLGGERISYIETTTYALPRRCVRCRVRASLPKRGRYIFAHATVHSGDFLGLEEKSMDFPVMKELVVLPERAHSPELESQLGAYLGDVSVSRFILSDPILTVGFREYTGREPQRDISWPRSLKDNRLMVKQYDYTAEMTASVMLNVYGGSPGQMEKCFSLSRSVCEALEEKRISYSFRTNACVLGAAGAWSYIPRGTGGIHLATILDGLGRATYDCRFHHSELINASRLSGDDSCALILITPTADEDILMAAKRFEANLGRRIFIISAEEQEEVEEC